MNDKDLQDAVIRELEWDPMVDAAHIGVSAKDGAITLTGHVPSYAEKLAAVAAAERVYGVRAIADEIEIRLPGSSKRDDTDLAQEIARELRWNTAVPETVEAEVRNGWVTLRGEVEWPYQRDAAERAIRYLTGVTGVSNLITVKPRVKPKPSEIKERIADAIKRMADLALAGSGRPRATAQSACTGLSTPSTKRSLRRTLPRPLQASRRSRTTSSSFRDENGRVR